MAFIDVSTLLQPVHPETPCGPDLEYSPAFLDAVRALEGSPEVQYGSLLVAAVEPDWKRVKSTTLGLLAQCRDLRLAVWLTRALLALHGIPGMADGLALVEGLIAQHWDSVHPQLDPADDYDPTARINVLLALDDKSGFVRDIAASPLVDSPIHGRVCLRDLEAADGDSRSCETPSDHSPAAIDAAFADAALEDVARVRDALASALSSLERIDARLTECIGHRRSVALAALEQTLGRASQAVCAQLARHPAIRVGVPSDTSSQAMTHPARGQPERLGDIDGREDVLHALDQLCAYYRRVEPSSPVPVLLERARMLVGVRFVDAVLALAPAGLEQARHWAGAEGE